MKINDIAFFPLCREVGDWSQDGCILRYKNFTHVKCQCNHLTNFAILMDVSGVEVKIPLKYHLNLFILKKVNIKFGFKKSYF